MAIVTSSDARSAMSTIHLNETTTSTPEQFVAGLTDFGPGRSELYEALLSSSTRWGTARGFGQILR
jgi:hypothetical protein